VDVGRGCAVRTLGNAFRAVHGTDDTGEPAHAPRRTALPVEARKGRADHEAAGQSCEDDDTFAGDDGGAVHVGREEEEIHVDRDEDDDLNVDRVEHDDVHADRDDVEHNHAHRDLDSFVDRDDDDVLVVLDD
jgi:hypothetical protein